MAIQLPNPGLGDGQTGDNEFVMWTKVKDNFSNSEHAASRLVGLTNGKVPLYEHALASALSQAAFTQINQGPSADLDTFRAGSVTAWAHSLVNAPPAAADETHWTIYTIAGHNQSPDYCHQLAFGMFNRPSAWIRNRKGGIWTAWQPLGQSISNYRVTTGTAPNVVVESDGTLKRSTSSEKYKDIIANLELDDKAYQKALNVKPIVYRSKADGDPNNWHYMSFSAEELGEYDPCLTQWRTHDDVVNEDTGELERVELEQKEAEGINLNAICAVLHATNIYQDKKLKELEQRLTALEQTDEPIE